MGAAKISDVSPCSTTRSGGGARPPAGDRLNGDLLGSDPRRAWNRAVREATDAVAQPGAEDRSVHLSYGDTPATSYIAEVAADLTVHAWDLARGIGFACTGAQTVDAQAAGQLPDPGADRAVVAEAVEVLVGPGEDLLEHVLCIGRRQTEGLCRDRIDVARETLHELGPGENVAAAAASDQFRVGGGLTGHLC